MTNRNFKRAAALSFLLGGLTLTPAFAQQTAAPGQPPAAANAAADACQASPKGAAPQGKHWYYHLDRSSGRKCWYLGQAGLKTTASSAAAKHKAAKPAPAENSEADTAPSTQQDAAEAAPQPAPKPAAAQPLTMTESEAATDPTADASKAPQTMPGTAPSAPLLTERWPDADAFRPSQTTTGQSTPLANAQPATTAAMQSAPSETTQATAPPSNTSAASPLADLTPWRMIFGVSFLVLALIAILTLVTYKYFWRTNDNVSNIPGRLRNIWGDNEDETAVPTPSYTDMIAPSRRTPARAPQDLDEIEQLLRRAAREPKTENVISLTDPATRARTPTAQSAAHASTVRRAVSFRPR